MNSLSDLFVAHGTRRCFRWSWAANKNAYGFTTVGVIVSTRGLEFIWATPRPLNSTPLRAFRFLAP